jgi:hypothetical protein
MGFGLRRFVAYFLKVLNRDRGWAGRDGNGARTGGGVGRWAPVIEDTKQKPKVRTQSSFGKCSESFTFGTESILVGDVADFDELTIGGGVGVAALHDLSFVDLAAILEVALLICSDSIRRFVAEASEKVS